MSLITRLERSRVLTAAFLVFALIFAGAPDRPSAQEAEEAAEEVAPAEEATEHSDAAPPSGEKAESEEESAAGERAAPATPESPAENASAPQPVDAPAAPSIRQADAPDDYYARRAKEMLKADGSASDAPPHPLAAAHPDKFVVVCEAGCKNGAPAEIVYAAPRSAAATEIVSAMVPSTSSGSAPAGHEDLGIACVAGCYDTPKLYAGRNGGSPALALPGQDFGGTWVTTVADASADEAEVAKPRQTNGGSGDWMARINRDQERNGATVVIAAAEPAPAPAAPPGAPASSELQKPDVTSQEAALADAPKASLTAETPAETSETAPASAETVTPEAASSEPVASTPVETPAILNPTATSETSPSVTPGPDALATPPIEPEVAVEISSEPAPAPTEPMEPGVETTAAEPTVTSPEVAPLEGKVAEDTDAEASGASVVSEQQVAAARMGDDTPLPATTAPAEGPAAEDPAQAMEPAAKPDYESAPGTAADQKVAVARDQVVTIATSDPEMNAAIAKARASLADFWKAAESPGEDETAFSLKVAIEGGGAVEHFWIVDVKRDGKTITGTINNEPELVKSVAMGQHYEFTEDRVTDWLFKRKGKMVGNETMRPLLKRMSKEEAEPYWAMYEKH